jgi:hypothetical protein
MDMNDAILRRLEANVEDSGWHVIEAQPDPSAVRFWLYTINIVRGPRLGTQANAEFFRDLQQETGKFKELKNSPYKPNQLLGSTIAGYDEAANDAERREMYKPLCFSLGAFARSTQTWEQLPPLKDVPGIHFVVTDWLEPDDNLVMRPMVFLSEKVPPIDVFIAGMATQLAMHLKRFPKGLPKEWSDLNP